MNASTLAPSGNGTAHGNGHAPNGAVLVCGGGVAGIQAALDLSAAGFAVYLVEESPTIGGSMARLDKTFPTGDCATCIISPKLVQCMRDYNIEVLTMADVMSLEGEAGAFKVEVQRRPRGVIADKCTGCGDCWKACPVRNVPQPTAADAARRAARRPQDAAWVDAILARYRDDRAPLIPVLQDMTDERALSAPPGAGDAGRAAEDLAGRDPPRGQFLQRLQPGAGGPAHDRSLPGHGVLRPRLGPALGAARTGTRHSPRAKPIPEGGSPSARSAASAAVRWPRPCGSTASRFGKVKLDKVVNILEQFA